MQPAPALRPRRVGELLDGAFRLYRSHVGFFLALGAITIVPLAIISLLLLAAGPMVGMVESLINLLIMPLLYGALTYASAACFWGRAAGYGEAYRASARRWAPILGGSILLGIVVAIPSGILGACVAFSLLSSGQDMAILTPLIIIVLLPLLALVTTRFALFVPAVVLDGAGPVDGLRRSWRLTSGHFGHTFGVVFVTGLLAFLVGQLPMLSVTYLGAMFGSSVTDWRLSAGAAALGQIGQLLALPIQYIALVLLYFDLRVRGEGLDLEMSIRDLVAPPS